MKYRQTTNDKLQRNFIHVSQWMSVYYFNSTVCHFLWEVRGCVCNHSFAAPYITDTTVSTVGLLAESEHVMDTISWIHLHAQSSGNWIKWQRVNINRKRFHTQPVSKQNLFSQNCDQSEHSVYIHTLGEVYTDGSNLVTVRPAVSCSYSLIRLHLNWF